MQPMWARRCVLWGSWAGDVCFGFTQSLSICMRADPSCVDCMPVKLQFGLCVVFCVRTLLISISSAILLHVDSATSFGLMATACQPLDRIHFILGSISSKASCSQGSVKTGLCSRGLLSST